MTKHLTTLAAAIVAVALPCYADQPDADTAEKAAQIYMLAAPLGGAPHRLSMEQLTDLAAKFDVIPDPEILGNIEE